MILVAQHDFKMFHNCSKCSHDDEACRPF